MPLKAAVIETSSRCRSISVTTALDNTDDLVPQEADQATATKGQSYSIVGVAGHVND